MIFLTLLFIARKSISTHVSYTARAMAMYTLSITTNPVTIVRPTPRTSLEPPRTRLGQATHLPWTADVEV